MRQRYQCKACKKRFDDLSDTIFAGHHQPLQTWIVCLYFMGLNLPNHQIAKELDLNKDDVQDMTSQLRHGSVAKKPVVTLQREVECDEAYVIAGHKGQPEAIKKKRESDVVVGYKRNPAEAQSTTPLQADGVWNTICSQTVDFDCNPISSLQAAGNLPLLDWRKRNLRSSA